jgi:hypothetical protein
MTTPPNDLMGYTHTSDKIRDMRIWEDWKIGKLNIKTPITD